MQQIEIDKNLTIFLASKEGYTLDWQIFNNVHICWPWEAARKRQIDIFLTMFCRYGRFFHFKQQRTPPKVLYIKRFLSFSRLDPFSDPLCVRLTVCPYPMGESRPTESRANYPYLLSKYLIIVYIPHIPIDIIILYYIPISTY